MLIVNARSSTFLHEMALLVLFSWRDISLHLHHIITHHGQARCMVNKFCCCTWTHDTPKDADLLKERVRSLTHQKSEKNICHSQQTTHPSCLLWHSYIKSITTEWIISHWPLVLPFGWQPWTNSNSPITILFFWQNTGHFAQQCLNWWAPKSASGDTD